MRSRLEDDLVNFTPDLDCIDCTFPDATYALIDRRVFVSLQNIPPDHREECIGTLFYLLDYYTIEIEKENK